jgi:ParB family chromosome partitioning protein
MAKKKPKINLSRPIPTQSDDFGALFTSTDDTEQAAGLQLLALRLDAIMPDPDQPRHTFHDETLTELAESIKQDGVIQPIEVTQVRKGQYKIVHGERRWRAAQLAGLDTIPAVVRRRTYDEVTRFVRQLVENIQREDLNDVDRAFGMLHLRDIMKEELNAEIAEGNTTNKPHSRTISWAKVSERLGFTRQRASQIIQLLDLPDEIKEGVRQGTISERDTRSLKGLKPSQQRALFRALEAGDVSKQEYKTVARFLKKEAPDMTVHQAIRVLHAPLPPGSESEFDTSLEYFDDDFDTWAETAKNIPNLPNATPTNKPTNIHRLHWIRGHLARTTTQNLTTAEQKEMTRMLKLIQEDVNSLITALND